jgi:hypothetical protein
MYYMNSARWRRENLVAWIVFCVICVIGAVIGLLYPLYELCNPSAFGQWTACSQEFLELLASPELYWARPTFGALLAGATYYLVTQMFVGRAKTPN